MDSAYYNAAVIGAIRRGGARFSVTAPMNSSIRAAIAAIGEDAWTAIRYPHAIWDDQLDCWISDAEVAEAEYTAFASKKGQAVTARLIVRRVRDLNKQAGTGQDELFPVWRYHAVFTDSPFELVQAEGQHRGHAVVEQVFADVTSAGRGRTLLAARSVRKRPRASSTSAHAQRVARSFGGRLGQVESRPTAPRCAVDKPSASCGRNASAWRTSSASLRCFAWTLLPSGRPTLIPRTTRASLSTFDERQKMRYAGRPVLLPSQILMSQPCESFRGYTTRSLLLFYLG